MLSFKQLLLSAPVALAFLGQVAMARKEGGETCANGPAYVIFPDNGPQVGYCGNNPRSVGRRISVCLPVEYRSPLTEQTCYSTTWAYDWDLNSGYP
jgi:hypothetical protein